MSRLTRKLHQWRLCGAVWVSQSLETHECQLGVWRVQLRFRPDTCATETTGGLLVGAEEVDILGGGSTSSK